MESYNETEIFQMAAAFCGTGFNDYILPDEYPAAAGKFGGAQTELLH